MSRKPGAPARPDSPSPGSLAGRLDPDMPWALRPAALSVVAALMRAHRDGSLPQSALQALTPADDETQRVAGAVAILTLRGIIRPRSSFLDYLFGEGGGGLERFRADFRAAVDNDDIGSILIEFDSPGGSVELIDETATEIREARGSKPIVAISNVLAASGGYWLAAQADEVIVTPSGMVGSIGVFNLHEDWSKFNEIMGVDPTYISAGEFKTEGNMDEPLSDPAREAIQRTVDDYYGMFVAAVAAGRNVPEADVRNGYGEGRVLPAQRALEAGMVDRVETLDQVVARLVAGDRTAGAVAEAAPVGGTFGAEVPAPNTNVRVDDGDATVPDAASPPGDREDTTRATPPWLLIPTPRH